MKWILSFLLISIIILSGCNQVENATSEDKGFIEDFSAALNDCETLSDDQLIEKCNGYQSSPVLCDIDKVGKAALVGTCKKIVMQQSKNSRICDYYSKLKEKEFCLFNVAIGSLDGTICEQTHNRGEIEGITANTKDACFREVAIGKASSSLCQKIGGKNIKDECYWKIAKANKDHSLCENVESEKSKERCIKDAK
jgi:hypothetical protein